MLNYPYYSRMYSFKKHIKDILETEICQSELTPEIKEVFVKYISKDWVYYDNQEYNSDALNIMIKSINSFQFILSRTYFKAKKDLLNYIEKLQNA